MIQVTMLCFQLSFVLFCVSSCAARQSHTGRAAMLMQKNDRILAVNGFYEFMTVIPPQPLIGSFKKHYITKKHRYSNVDEARQFFCAFLDSVLTPLNQEKLLRPYLQNYPMTFQDIDLQVVFVDQEDRPCLPPHFCSIRKVDDLIYYEHYDPKIKKSVAFAIERADRAFRIYNAELKKEAL